MRIKIGRFYICNIDCEVICGKDAYYLMKDLNLLPKERKKKWDKWDKQQEREAETE